MYKDFFAQESEQAVIRVVSSCKNVRQSRRYTHSPQYRGNGQILLLGQELDC